MGPEAKSESGADPSNLAEGTAPAYPRDSPLRPEIPVCGYRLCSASGGKWSIKEEEVDLSEYADYWDASWQMGQFLEDAYMQKCIHWSPGYLIPVEFERQWLAQQDVPEAVH